MMKYAAGSRFVREDLGGEVLLPEPFFNALALLQLTRGIADH